jgi:hypothetical protein
MRDFYFHFYSVGLLVHFQRWELLQIPFFDRSYLALLLRVYFLKILILPHVTSTYLFQTGQIHLFTRPPARVSTLFRLLLDYIREDKEVYCKEEDNLEGQTLEDY